MFGRGFRSTVYMIFAVMLILAGCGGTGNEKANNDSGAKEGGKVKIRFAHFYTGADPKADTFKQQMDAFRAAHPEIELIEETAAGDELKTKLKVDIAGNNIPDLYLYWAGESYLRPMLDEDLLLNMNDYFAASETVQKDQWSQAAWDDTAVDGGAYIVPIEASKAFFVYNKEIFDKYRLMPPTTYEEFKEVSKVFRENGIIPLSTGSKGSNPGHWFYSAIATQFAGGVEDGEKLNKDYKFDTDAFNRAAQIIYEMKSLKIFPDDTIATGDWAPSIVPYNEGKAAMLFTLPWTLLNLNEEITAKSGLMHFPKMEGAVMDPATYTIGGYTSGLVINKESFENPAKKEAIVAVADAVLSDETMAVLVGGGAMPAKSLQSDIDSLDPFTARVFHFTDEYGVVPFTKSQLPGAKSTEVFNRATDELFAGVIKPDEFISKIDKALAEENK